MIICCICYCHSPSYVHCQKTSRFGSEEADSPTRVFQDGAVLRNCDHSPRVSLWFRLIHVVSMSICDLSQCARFLFPVPNMCAKVTHGRFRCCFLLHFFSLALSPFLTCSLPQKVEKTRSSGCNFSVNKVECVVLASKLVFWLSVPFRSRLPWELDSLHVVSNDLAG